MQAKECAGRLIFLELLFWKNARDAEVVRDEYQWRVCFFSWKLDVC